TESIAMRDEAETRLSLLRQLGFSIALDDFGTGHSSLSVLRSLAINQLKIDRSFVADLQDDGVARSVTAGVISLRPMSANDVVSALRGQHEQACAVASVLARCEVASAGRRPAPAKPWQCSRPTASTSAGSGAGVVPPEYGRRQCVAFQ